MLSSFSWANTWCLQQAVLFIFSSTPCFWWQRLFPSVVEILRSIDDGEDSDFREDGTRTTSMNDDSKCVCMLVLYRQTRGCHMIVLPLPCPIHNAYLSHICLLIEWLISLTYSRNSSGCILLIGVLQAVNACVHTACRELDGKP